MERINVGEKIHQIKYLAAARRAEIEYATRARNAESRDLKGTRGIHRRLAARHERKACAIGEEILAILDRGGL